MLDIDPRFRLEVDELDGQARLRLRAVADCSIDLEETFLLGGGFAEFAGLARAGDGWTAEFAEPSLRRYLVNGWQSWSFAGELGPHEYVPPSWVRRFRFFSQGPARPARRHGHLSYFYLGLLAGEGRLFLVSRNPGGAPLVFRADRHGRGIRVGFFAKGARYAAGDLVAEIRLFWREGGVAAKEAFRAIFAEERHFERLAFLGSGGRLVPGGYESWYNHYTDISEELIATDLEGLAEPGNLISEYYVGRGKPTVFQVDDGWQIRVGEWSADLGKFPSGMRALGEGIEARGYIPGLWLAPILVTKKCSVCRDNPGWILRDEAGEPVLAGWNPNWEGDFWCLDLSLPEVEEYLLATFERVVEDWGFRYLKLDFLYAAFLPGVRKGGGAAFEHYERVIGRITSRHATRGGKPVAWLGCGAPLESSWRHFPLMRIGADTREAWEYGVLKLAMHEGRPAAYANLLATIGRSVLDGTVFVNDPDVVFCREANNRLSPKEKELVGLVDFMLASQIMYSDGADEVRTPSVRAFTAGLVAAFDRLEGREYHARRIARDVFGITSADGAVRALANLSERAWSEPGEAWEGRAIVEHARRRRGLVFFEPHTISIYERNP